MSENLSFALIAWLFLLVLGACVLINAMVDIGARELCRWLAARWTSSHSGKKRIDISP